MSLFSGIRFSFPVSFRYSLRALACFWLLALPLRSRAQYDTVSIFDLPLQLDSFVVRSGFDISAFIRRVRTDTTFYRAFRNMRFVPYSAANNITVLDRRGRVKASLFSRTRQVIEKNCRRTRVLEEQTTGDFYTSSGSYRYYTADLYAYLFFAKQPVCNESDGVAELDVRGKGQMERSKYELKQLIFNPGARVSGIPFMGDRASIFDPGESWKYDFRITQDSLAGEDCFVFRITPKPAYRNRALYNELTTWFRHRDYAIIARDYALSYSTLLYDFDVRMKVRTTERAGRLYPTVIDYDGDWHIVTKRRERVRFRAENIY